MELKFLKAIKKQINACQKHEDYRALIAICSRRHKYTIDKWVEYIIRDVKNLNNFQASIVKQKHETIVHFINGSSLRVTDICFKGYHVHNIIADACYSNDFLNCVLEKMLIPYKYKRVKKISRQVI